MSSDDEKKEIEKQKKKDAPYLNSVSRIVRRILFSVIETAIVIVLLLMIASYFESGTIDNAFSLSGGMKDMLSPGGLVFNSLIGYIPVLVLANICTYFGSGSKGKLAAGVLRCIAIAVWLIVIFGSAADSLTIPSVAEGTGLESIEVGVRGIAKFGAIIFAACAIIPVGEYIGARKEHEAAVERKRAGYQS
ncbi:hypothetical protein AUQ37_07500 [Candidatus Methanomethylophilus sp. 1R26]|uniref:hypothetical protein n=1 Tax=Candidatus Methanomethylophilus sp. 1R26 TaxID=1769296 RepID=UPI0007368467|nr:hypothetical protein [Candidatus Methanomethylophilus sp. 1R26]KUE73805.1 hypothetical protein AUQ37_07500 [Candidatus Methanomethylophilus sp. 1R26]MEE3400815.1 hypothetical protein [Methanomethylophilus sp.]TQS83188.1 MAG: hypothetical protein A3Q59_03565 [Methanomethylophilus alvi]